MHLYLVFGVTEEEIDSIGSPVEYFYGVFSTYIKAMTIVNKLKKAQMEYETEEFEIREYVIDTPTELAIVMMEG